MSAGGFFVVVLGECASTSGGGRDGVWTGCDLVGLAAAVWYTCALSSLSFVLWWWWFSLVYVCFRGILLLFFFLLACLVCFCFSFCIPELFFFDALKFLLRFLSWFCTIAIGFCLFYSDWKVIPIQYIAQKLPLRVSGFMSLLLCTFSECCVYFSLGFFSF